MWPACEVEDSAGPRSGGLGVSWMYPGTQRRHLRVEHGNPDMSWPGGPCDHFKVLGVFSSTQIKQAISIHFFAKGTRVFLASFMIHPEQAVGWAGGR